MMDTIFFTIAATFIVAAAVVGLVGYIIVRVIISQSGSTAPGRPFPASADDETNRSPLDAGSSMAAFGVHDSASSWSSGDSSSSGGSFDSGGASGSWDSGGSSDSGSSSSSD